MMDFGWEWETKKDHWVKYENDVNKKLSEGVKNGDSEVKFTIEKSNLVVNLSKMMQKNSRTGFERSVRCTLKDENGTTYAWEWQDENGRWRSYQPNVMNDIENCHKNSTATYNFSINEQSYTIDFDNNQQKNDVTDIVRQMRRHATSADHSSTASPAPPVRMTRSRSCKKAPDETITNGTKTEPEKSDDDNEKPPPAKRAKSSVKSKQKGTSKGAAGSSEVKSEESTKRKIVVKGRAPVDPECHAKLENGHVYFEGNDVYDVMLNQTNVQNNNNKYYVIQLIADDNAKIYSVWFRWGRVGFKGQSSLVPCGPDLESAKKLFCQKFWDKSKNEWAMRKKFSKVAGKYDQIQVDYSVDKAESSTSNDTPEVKQEEDTVPDSKLDASLQALLKLICDIKAMEQTVTEMEYDAQEAPLGKLTTSQIKAGYAALKKIEGCIEKGDFGRKLLDACNEYYTRIPHCFGMRTPPLIRDTTMLKKEIDLLEALSDIEVAIRTLKTEETKVKMHPVDRHYQSMKCDLTPMDQKSDQFKMVDDYLQNTHAPTHLTYKMKTRHVYELQKHGEEESFNDVGNKMLLWHGSRLTNWYGILSQGLRIAPPEAPVTGYMFGKGVYFADMSSKSANYCFATKQKNVGIVLLCEVALGKTRDLLAADYKADKLPEGFDSVKGFGSIEPDPKDQTTLENGCVVPLGKPVNTKVQNPGGYTLNYNEYVVYDTNQVKLKYLVEVDFKF